MNTEMMRKEVKIASIISKIRDRVLTLVVNKLKENGIENLSKSHCDILIFLYQRNEEVNMKEVSERIGKDKSTVTGLVQKLIKFEYIGKRKDEDDKRISYLFLKQKGKELKSIFLEAGQYAVERIYKGFEEKEKALLIQMLERVLENVK